MATAQLEKERRLQRDVAQAVESALPDVEVLALELNGKERFCVYVDHPKGVDHALCERVTGVLRPYLESTASRSPRRGSNVRCGRGPISSGSWDARFG